MIKFFRQSYAIQYVVIALMAIALWIPAFISGKATVGLDEPVTPFFNLVNRLLRGSAVAQHAVAFVLLVLETMVFNTIMVKHQIVGKVSTMGAFVFVLLMSLTVTQTNFYPFAFSNVEREVVPTLKVGEGISGQVFKNWLSVFVPDRKSHPAFSIMEEEAFIQGSFISVPVGRPVS